MGLSPRPPTDENPPPPRPVAGLSPSGSDPRPASIGGRNSSPSGCGAGALGSSAIVFRLRCSSPPVSVEDASPVSREVFWVRWLAPPGPESAVSVSVGAGAAGGGAAGASRPAIPATNGATASVAFPWWPVTATANSACTATARARAPLMMASLAAGGEAAIS
jgi:hypothetical protein